MKCPECNCFINKNEEICPNCGYPIKEKLKEIKKDIKIDELLNKKIFNNKILCIFMIIYGLIELVLYWNSIKNHEITIFNIFSLSIIIFGVFRLLFECKKIKNDKVNIVLTICFIIVNLLCVVAEISHLYNIFIMKYFYIEMLKYIIFYALTYITQIIIYLMIILLLISSLKFKKLEIIKQIKNKASLLYIIGVISILVQTIVKVLFIFYTEISGIIEYGFEIYYLKYISLNLLILVLFILGMMSLLTYSYKLVKGGNKNGTN